MTMKKQSMIFWVGYVVLLLVSATVTPAQVTKHEPAHVVSDKPADKPVVTELQQTKLDKFNAELDDIATHGQVVAGPILMQKQQVIEEIVKANPGYVWHTPQSEKDSEGLIKESAAQKMSAPTNGVQSPATPATPAANTSTPPAAPTTPAPKK
jgi:hypothetical protein